MKSGNKYIWVLVFNCSSDTFVLAYVCVKRKTKHKHALTYDLLTGHSEISITGIRVIGF